MKKSEYIEKYGEAQRVEKASGEHNTNSGKNGKIK
jgi:hypothetical protein